MLDPQTSGRLESELRLDVHKSSMGPRRVRYRPIPARSTEKRSSLSTALPCARMVVISAHRGIHRPCETGAPFPLLPVHRRCQDAFHSGSRITRGATQ